MALCVKGEGTVKGQGRTINISRCVAFSEEHGKYFTADISCSIHNEDREHVRVVKIYHFTWRWQNCGCAPQLCICSYRFKMSGFNTAEGPGLSWAASGLHLCFLRCFASFGSFFYLAYMHILEESWKGRRVLGSVSER